MKSFFKKRKGERGAVVTLVAIIIVALLGVTGLVVDLGFLYAEKSKLALACDAASLVAALQLPDTSRALAKAKEYAAKNGFTDGVEGVVVSGTLNPDGEHPNWYRVTITKQKRLFFMPVLGFSETTLSNQATAEYVSLQPISTWSEGTYGTEGTQSLEISGPDAYYDYGDPYGTKYLDHSSYEPNPQYNPEGYNFGLFIPSDYSTQNGTSIVNLELYDPTCGSSNDENYYAHGASALATTVFSLYAPDDTPSDYSDDVLVATATYAPNDPGAKLKWVTPDGFEFDSSTYGTGNYRVNVKTTSGSGGNAFHMRAGPPPSCHTETQCHQECRQWRRGRCIEWEEVCEEVEVCDDFDPNNGTSISATGHLQMFFLNGGTVHPVLGYIPSEAAGMKLHITKFDTDVGATSVTYTDGGQINWQGTLSGNGTWREDVYTIPVDYQGGTLTANYSAGSNDTSVWEMWYEGTLPGQAGHVKLVE